MNRVFQNNNIHVRDGLVSIEMKHGIVSIVSIQDYETIRNYKWCAAKRANTHYAVARDRKTKKNVLMHRILLNAKPDEQVDHRDGDGLNNQRNNIRKCSIFDNMQHTKFRKNNTSGHRGVQYRSDRGVWSARIMAKRRYISLGCFAKKEAAVMAYFDAAKKYHGEFLGKELA